MSDSVYDTHDAVGLAELVKVGEVSPKELVREGIERVERLNPDLNAVSIKSYELAEELSSQVNSSTGVLAGVPFVIKDLAIDWAGLPTTNSCAYFQDYVAQKDWEICARLRRGGLIPLGKSNVPEYGFSLSTAPRLRGRTYNPWDKDVVTGGSSGGSSVAVASGMVPVADASDGGGSIRIPACINGLVGLKPSRGRVTMGPDVVDFWYGASVFNSVTRTVRDTAAYLDVIGGAYPGEPYALPMPKNGYLSLLKDQHPRLKIGLVTNNPGGGPIDAEVLAAVEHTARLCESLGHVVEPFTFTYDWDALDVTFGRLHNAMTAHSLAAAERVFGRPVTQEELEPTIWQILQEGSGVTLYQMLDDEETFRRIGRDVATAVDDFDVLISPVLPFVTPAKEAYDTNTDLKAYRREMHDSLVFTLPFNVSGQPAVTLPLSMTESGLPVGTQLAGRIGTEGTLLQLALDLEQADPWVDRHPGISVWSS